LDAQIERKFVLGFGAHDVAPDLICIWKMSYHGPVPDVGERKPLRAGCACGIRPRACSSVKFFLLLGKMLSSGISFFHEMAAKAAWQAQYSWLSQAANKVRFRFDIYIL
jgi:hypothetical protein